VETVAYLQIALAALAFVAVVYLAAEVRAIRAELRASRGAQARISAREHEATRESVRETMRAEAQGVRTSIGLAHGSLDVLCAMLRQIVVRQARADLERADTMPSRRFDLLSDATPTIESPPPSSRPA